MRQTECGQNEYFVHIWLLPSENAPAPIVETDARFGVKLEKGHANQGRRGKITPTVWFFAQKNGEES